MRLDDRFMTFLTALVLIIAIGALVHGNGDGSSLFGGADRFVAREDRFTLRAGRVQTLEVLLNDSNVEAIDPTTLRVETPPSCGYALPLGGGIQFSDSLGCSGTIQFAYCVPVRGECEPAMVTLAVVKVDEELEQLAAQDRVKRIVAPDVRIAAPAASGVTTAAAEAPAPERAAEAEPLQSVAALQPQAADPVVAERSSARPVVAAGPTGGAEAGFGQGVSVGASPQGVIPAQEAAPLAPPQQAVAAATAERPQGPAGIARPEAPTAPAAAPQTAMAPALSAPSAPETPGGVTDALTSEGVQLVELPARDPVISAGIGGDLAAAGPGRLPTPEDTEVTTPGDATSEIRIRPTPVSPQMVATDIPLNPGDLIRPQPSLSTARVATRSEAILAPQGPEANEAAPVLGAALSQPRPAAPRRVLPRLASLGDSNRERRATAPAAQVALDRQASAPNPGAEAGLNSGLMTVLTRQRALLGTTATAATSLAVPTRDVTRPDVSIAALRPRATVAAVAAPRLDPAPGASSAVALPGSANSVRPERGTAIAALNAALPANLGFQRRTQEAPSLMDLAAPAPSSPGSIGGSGEPRPGQGSVDVVSLPVGGRGTTVSLQRPTEADVSCGIRLDLSRGAAATIKGSITSPCRPNTVFDVTHAGLTYSTETNARGAKSFSFPAFEEVAEVTVTAADGATASGRVRIGTLSGFLRIAVAWRGQVDLDLHAREFGAADLSDGHVRPDNPRDYRAARRQGGGYLAVLGQDGLSAGGKLEVYTVPDTSRLSQGLIDLSLEVSGGIGSCDGTVLVQSVRAIGSDVQPEQDVEIDLGACDRVGGLIVQDVVRDLQIARN